MTGKRCHCCIILNHKLKHSVLKKHFEGKARYKDVMEKTKAEMTKAFVNSTTDYCKGCINPKYDAANSTKKAWRKQLLVCPQCHADGVWDHGQRSLSAHFEPMSTSAIFDYLFARLGNAKKLVPSINTGTASSLASDPGEESEKQKASSTSDEMTVKVKKNNNNMCYFQLLRRHTFLMYDATCSLFLMFSYS
jgi:hypothetical protein